EPQLFLVSAMDASRLREYVQRHVDHLAQHPDRDLAALCRTTRIGREAMAERLALRVDSLALLREALASWLDHGAVPPGVCLWHGRAEAGAGPVGADQRERMQALCAGGELDALAELWVRGGKVDWQR